MLKIEEKYINYKNNPWGCIESYSYDDICIHNTANSASADNEWSYLNSRAATGEGYATYHYVVDENKAIKCMPLSIDAWAVSDGSGKGGNTTDIHIEIARSTSDGDLYNRAFKNAMKLTAIICKDKNWKPEGRIKFHHDYKTKYCPHHSLDDFNGDVNKLRQHVVDEVNKILNEGDYPMKKLDDNYSRAEIWEDEEVIYGGKHKVKAKKDLMIRRVDSKGNMKDTGNMVHKNAKVTTDYYKKVKSSNGYTYNYHALVPKTPTNKNLDVICVDCDGDK